MNRVFPPDQAKGGLHVREGCLKPENTACLFIEFQNEFTTEGGKLHDAVKGVMAETRNYSMGVTDIPVVGFYSLPKKMGRTGRFINDGLRLISLGSKQKQKNTNTVQKPNTVLVAFCHFPPSPYRIPVGSSANKSLQQGYP